MIAFLNGEWLEQAVARIGIDDLGFLQGDGVFETARLYRGAYFRLAPHLERLAQGAAMLQLHLPAPRELTDVALELARRNPMDHGTLRITATRGRTGGARSTLLATLQPIPPEWERRAERGWHIGTARTRRPGIAAVPSQLKSIGRIYAILARLEERAAGTDDVLLLTENGAVCEGPSWNVFWRNGSLLRTPSAATGALEGVTRATVLEIASEAGFRVEQGEWPRNQLDAAEEIFATMSSLGIVPIRSLDQRVLPSDAAATLLQASYWHCVARETGTEWGTERA